MVSSNFEFWVKIVQIIIIILILTYFVVRRVKDKITGFTWFIVLFSSAILQASTEILIYFLTKANVIDSNSTLQEIHIIPYALGLFTLFLYCELIMRTRPNAFLFGFMTLLLGAYLTTYFIELAYGLNMAIPPKYRINRVIFNIFQFFVLVEATYMFVKDTLNVEYKKLRKITLVISIAMGTSAIFAFFKIFEYWLPFSFYGAIPYGILFGVLAIEFIANPFFVYLLPARINKVVVFDESGLLLYAVRVGKEQPDIVESTLLSGTLTAVKQLMKETTGADSDLEKIAFRDKYLIIAENTELNVSTIVICDRDSFMLQIAAKQFIDAFSDKFSHILTKFDGSVEKFEEATDLVKRIFPFVPPLELFQEERA